MNIKHLTSTSGKRRFKKRLGISVLVIAVLCSVYFFIDYKGPEIIPIKNDTAFGLPCSRAADLVVQEYDKYGNLWATRGMIIYQLKNGEDKFIRIAHIPTGFTIFWLRNFSIIRKLTIRPECVEMVATEKGDLCALSGGRLWLLRHGETKFLETFRLSYYGFGDQGVRNDGILVTDDGSIYLGEYYQNPERNKVDLYKSSNNISSWNVAHEFQPKAIRHIHAIQNDPYSDKLWICTGDDDEESIVGWSDDEFRNIHSIGKGSQLWRACQLIFSEESVLWGTDTGSEADAGIYGWDRKSAELKKYRAIDGAIFYATRLKNGTIVLSSDREGLKSEKDDKTRLYVISQDNKITSIQCGTWNHKKPGFWFKYALLRIQRDQGGTSLAISCINQKELPDSELIIISEETLQSFAGKQDNNNK